jgi:Gpi18-like mannosyltransferase
MWLSSRMIIWIAMLWIAPALPIPASGEVPGLGWEVFSQWDSEHYQRIVTRGYRFRDDGKGYNVAFFPLYPLLVKGVMSLGLSVEVAGAIVNNVAFGLALVVLYCWVAERQGETVARWSTAVLAWCPFSLFGAVIYTEGLFLLLSTAALRAFDRQQYAWASFFGALTTAVRPPGVALIPTFLWVAWREKRGLMAYCSAVISAAGLLLYMLYCWWQFNQPLAFLLAQRGWRPLEEFHWKPWVSLLTAVLVGPVNEDQGRLVDWGYPLGMVAIAVLAFWVWRSRHKIGSIRAGYMLCGLAFILWLVVGSPLFNVVMVFGGIALLWITRYRLSATALTYGVWSMALILSLGRTISTERLAYGVVTLAIALGLVLSRYPRWGYVTMIFFGVWLANLSVRFAQGLWAG